MTIRVHHIVDVLMTSILGCVVLSLVNFFYYLKGISLTPPIMAIVCFMGIYLLFEKVRIHNVNFQLWGIFNGIYFIIAYLAMLFYQEIHPKIDMPYNIRAYFYNLILVLVTYRYALFCIHRHRFAALVNLLTALFTLGSMTVIFAIPLGFYRFQYAILPPILSIDRLAGIYFNPNAAGFNGNVTMIFGFATLLRPGSPKLLGIIAIVAGVLAILVSFSKTAILTFILSIGILIWIYFLMYRKIDRPTRRVANVMFAFIFYGLVQLGILIGVFFNDLSKQQQQRIFQVETILTGKADKSSTSNRVDLAELGVKKISERPLFGSGIFSFVQLLEAGNVTGDDVGVHNIFLRVWGEAGILPFCLFILFWVSAFWCAALIPTAWLRFLIFSIVLVLAFYSSTNHNILEDNSIGIIISFICAGLVAQTQMSPDKPVQPLSTL